MLLQLLPLVCRRRACSTNDHGCAPAHSRGNGNRNSLTASPRPAATLSRYRPHLAVPIPTSQPIARGSQIPIAPSRHAVLPTPTRGFLPRGFSDACLRASLAPAFGRHPKTLNESSHLPLSRHPSSR